MITERNRIPGLGAVPVADRGRLVEIVIRAPNATDSARTAMRWRETSGQPPKEQFAALLRMAAAKHPNGTESDQLVGGRYLAR
jgi:hypothetical protein